MSMTVLKLGWEFPPHHKGGLGVACEGLVNGLTHHGINVILLLPRAKKRKRKNCKIIPLYDTSLTVLSVDSSLYEYSSYKDERLTSYRKKENERCLYAGNIFKEVARYTHACIEAAKREQFDLIHAHDWMTYQAGVAIKKISGKPLTIHVHATEFDRSGGGPVNQTVYDIEKLGMEHADKVIAVSKFTKQKIIDRYAIPPEKIAIIHNAVARKKGNRKPFHANKKNPLVLFLGRLTLQKGPDYFLDVAKKVLEHRDDVDFVIAGSGDMQHRLIECVTGWGIGDKVIFTGFLRGQEVDRMYQMADVYVMPSVSEPFGIAALEAMQEGVPLIVSRNAGVSEVVNHCLKIDFWDINRMTDSILAILEHAELSKEMSKNGKAEVKKFCWNKVAQQCIEVYRFIV